MTFAVPLSSTICAFEEMTLPPTVMSPFSSHCSEIGAVDKAPENKLVSTDPRICSPVPSVPKASPKRHAATEFWLQSVVKKGVAPSSDSESPAKPTRPSCGNFVIVELLGWGVERTLAMVWVFAVRPAKDMVSEYSE